MNWTQFKTMVSKLIALNNYETRKVDGYDTFFHNQAPFVETMKQKCPFIYIYGKVGVGKTFQMLTVEKNMNGVKYIKWNDLVDFNLKLLRGEQLKNDEFYINNWKNGTLYIIDDFLTSKLSQTQMELIYKIIDYRTEKGYMLWINSNYNLAEVERMLNVESSDAVMKYRIMSRLQLFKIVEAIGPDLRRYKPNEKI